MKTVEHDTYKNLAAFRLALRRFLAFSASATRAAGVTPQQYQVLLVIGAETGGAVMMRDLAEQMLLKPHGAVQMVDRLVAAGLLQRRHSPSDARSVYVGLTEKGSALLELLASQHARELLQNEPILADALDQLRRMGHPRDSRAQD